MDITYLGHSAFLFKTKDARVVTDPFNSTKLNMPFPKQEADIVTISHDHDDHNATDQVAGEPLVLSLPGEYEKNAVRIYGFESFHDKTHGDERGINTLFKFEIEGISILHCGDLGHTLSTETIQEIGDVDIVLVPVGGFYTIDAQEARQIVEKLEPSIVIPMHYRNASLSPNIEHYADMALVDDFLEKVGATDVEPVKKLTVKQADFAEEENMKIVVMMV